MLGINPILEIMNSNNGITRSITIPRIQLELDEVVDGRKCSILFPETKPEPVLEVEKTLTRKLSEKIRKKRRSSFTTFQIIDENNCGM